jgi:hypothetical protein
MTRLASIACIAAFLATACTVGESGEGGPPDNGGGPDAGGNAGGADAAPNNTPDGGGGNVDCVEPVATSDNGHHNAGLDCMGCHGPGGSAPRWYAAGTLYTSADGSAPLAGATVTVKDANGQEVTIVTATNGNFWTDTQLAYPLTVKASRCPDTKAMVSSVQSPASCNSCHSGGGGTPGRIHLP